MFGKGSLDQANPRRSVYLTVKRGSLIPMLQLFDAPPVSVAAQGACFVREGVEESGIEDLTVDPGDLLELQINTDFYKTPNCR